MLEPTSATALKTIPYGCQTLGEEEVEAVIEVLKSPYLTQGPQIKAFEEAAAEYCQVPYAVAFSSGTAALHAAYFAAGLQAGDEAITTPISFVATSNAMLYQNATPVFADIHSDTWQVNPDEIKAKMTSKTKVLAPVHFAGAPADLEAMYRLADEHNLVVIEDACHALGAKCKGKPIGQCRDMAVFSFHPVKSITTGEGGMVVTPNRAYYEKLLQFRTHGITKQRETFTQFEGLPWEYEMQHLGFNYRMTDIQAAMGLIQLSKLDGFIQRRQELAQRYREAFASCSAIRCQQIEGEHDSAYHLFVIELNPEKTSKTRLELYNYLKEQGIHTQVHYIPIHWQPYYQTHLGTSKGQFPNAEIYYQHCLSLPLFPTLSDTDQDRVIQAILIFFRG